MEPGARLAESRAAWYLAVSTRWQQIELLYSEALKREPSARAAFLQQACPDDELRLELESLLAEAERASLYLSSPRFESALRSVVESPADGTLVQRERRPAFFWFAVAAGIGLLVFYLCSGLALVRNTGAQDFGWWPSASSTDGSIVGKVDVPGAAASKLESGDRILAFNGDTRVTRVGADVFRQFLPPGATYTIRIERHGITHDYALHVRPWHGSLSEVITYLLISIVFCLSGLALGLLKPGERVAQLGCLAQLLMVLRAMSTPLSFNSGTPPHMEFVLNQIASFTFPSLLAVSYHFLFRVSAASAREPIWRAIRNLLYVITGALLVSQLTWFAASLRGQEALVSLAYRHFWIAELNIVFLRRGWEAVAAMALGGACAVLMWGYRHSTDADYRRRIRWFAVGCSIGLAPELALNLVGAFLSITGNREFLQSASWDVLRWVADGFLVAIPVSLTWAILRRQLLDIHIVVRRGLRYIMARRVLQAILVLPFLGLILPILFHPNRTLLDSLRRVSSIANLLLLALCGVSMKYRKQMYDWLDRKFFRTAYQQENILRTLIAKIRDCDSADQVCRLVCNELYSALQPQSLFVCSWQGESGALSIVRASDRGAVETPGLLPANILELLEACKSARACALPAGSAGPEFGEAPGLVIPIFAGSPRACGALLLGQKKSDEPYTDTDLDLLGGIADAMGVKFENLRLKQRADEGLRERREVLGRLDRQAIQILRECPHCGTCFGSSDERCTVDQSELTLSLPVERTIAQRYRLDRRIGKGGMGVVFAATDLHLRRLVAVKVMTGNLFGDRVALSRFEREARALARLNHPHIVAIHDYGQLGGDGAYLVMELLTGASWRSELKRLGRIPPVVAAAWLDQLLSALRAAHGAGVVHRDLKPENVIISSLGNASETLKVLDFGLAKMRSEASSLTDTGVAMGTLKYMSPEQLRGEPTDERTDLFSVAIMVVEAIAGQAPSRAQDGSISVPAFQELVQVEPAGAGGELRRILLWCLASRVDDRCPNANEMQQVVNILRLSAEGASSAVA